MSHCIALPHCSHVGDPNDELLVLEVWDSDEVRVGASKIKGVKGVGQ